MFFNNKINQILDILNNPSDEKKLTKEIRELKDQLEDLKSKKRREEEDIVHLVHIKEEKLGLKFKKKEMDLEAEYQTQLATNAKSFRDKTEKMLSNQNDDLKKMYTQVLDRLPDINVKMKKEL